MKKITLILLLLSLGGCTEFHQGMYDHRMEMEKFENDSIYQELLWRDTYGRETWGR